MTVAPTAGNLIGGAVFLVASLTPDTANPPRCARSVAHGHAAIRAALAPRNGARVGEGHLLHCSLGLEAALT